jgi:hypothetical protein
MALQGKMWAPYDGDFSPASDNNFQGEVAASWTADFHPADWNSSFIVAMPLIQAVASYWDFGMVAGISGWVQNGFPVGPLPPPSAGAPVESYGSGSSWHRWLDGSGFTSVTFSLFLAGQAPNSTAFTEIAAGAMGIIEFWE